MKKKYQIFVGIVFFAVASWQCSDSEFSGGQAGAIKEKEPSADQVANIPVDDGDKKNLPPIIKDLAKEHTITEFESFSYKVSAEDPEGNPLGYEVKADGLPGKIAIDEQGLISYAAPEDSAGTYKVIVTVFEKDNPQNTVVAELQLKVEPLPPVKKEEVELVNSAPIIEAIADQSITEGNTLSFQIVATDKENDDLIYEVSSATLPGIIEVNSSGAVKYESIVNSRGNHVLTVKVYERDDPASFAVQGVNLEIIYIAPPPPPNLTPVISGLIQAHEMMVYDVFEYHVSASDPENDPIGYAVSSEGLIGEITIDASGKIFYTAPENSQGNYKVKVKVYELANPDKFVEGEFVLSIISCSESTSLGIWIDSDDSGEIKEENYKGEILSYKYDLDAYKNAADNYNYFSASAHPIIGPQPSNYSSKIFFYEDMDGLNFNFYHNKDEDGSIDWVDVDWDIKTSDNGLNDTVLLSDDGAELNKVSSDALSHSYEARWSYMKNTDGGVIGPFVGESFKIQVKVINSQEINEAGFFSADGTSFDLKDPNDPTAKVHSFIIGFKSKKTCSQ